MSPLIPFSLSYDLIPLFISVAVDTRIVQPVWFIMNHQVRTQKPPHTKGRHLSFCTSVYNESYGNGKGGRVRVDKIFVYSLDPVGTHSEVQDTHVRTRFAAETRRAAQAPDNYASVLSYLPADTLWEYLMPGAAAKYDLEKFKGLVPVELKVRPARLFAVNHLSLD